jgi:hypothetical protein
MEKTSLGLDCNLGKEPCCASLRRASTEIIGVYERLQLGDDNWQRHQKTAARQNLVKPPATF